MSPEELRQVVHAFRANGRAARNLFLWLGPVARLDGALGHGRVFTLSGIHLAEGIDPGLSTAAVARQMSAALTTYLDGITDYPAVVVARECGVMARYLSDFAAIFRWLDSRRLILLVCPPINIARLGPMPDGVTAQPDRIANALRRHVAPEQVVEVV